MEKYKKQRIYDGENCDLGFQLTYVSSKKGKIKKWSHSKDIIVENMLVLENCNHFYEARIKNYRQMISDFTHFSINNIINIYYYPTLIVKKDDNIILCHVKIDEINNLRYLKFNFTVLSNELCIHNYIGDIEEFMKNIITSGKGYEFYIKNKRKNFDNLKEVISFYLKKAKMKNYFYSMDNVIVLTEQYKSVALKYLKREYLKTNLYIKSPYNDNKILNLFGIYLSCHGNLLFILNNCDNFCEEYSKLIPILENSYDILKQYMLMNEYYIKKYENYHAPLQKTKKLKNDLKELCFFEYLREGLLKKSMWSVNFILKDFERNCLELNFSKKINRIKNNIIKELKARKISLTEIISETTSKTIGEITERILDKYN